MYQIFKTSGNSKLFVVPPKVAKELLEKDILYFSVTLLDDGTYAFTPLKKPSEDKNGTKIRNVNRSYMVGVPKHLYYAGIEKFERFDQEYSFSEGENHAFYFVPMRNLYFLPDPAIIYEAMVPGTIIHLDKQDQFFVVASSKAFNSSTSTLLTFEVVEHRESKFTIESELGFIELTKVHSIFIGSEDLTVVGHVSDIIFAKLHMQLHAIFDLGGD